MSSTNKIVQKIFTPALCAAVILMTLFSTVMTAYAWYDFTQSRTNDFRGTVAKTNVVLHKYEKTPEGKVVARPVANAEFLLYHNDGGDNWTQLGDVFTTNASGKISVEKLNSGTYKFVEIFPGYGYEYDRDDEDNEIREYDFVISPDDAEGAALVAVEAYNRRKTNSLEISKNVKGEGADPEQVFEFTVVFSDGGTYDYSIDGIGSYVIKSGETLYLKHGETAIFENLPVGLHYEINESFDPFYQVKSTGSSGNIKLKKTSKAKFVNTYETPEDRKTTITVEKIVKGEIPETEKDREFWFTLNVNFDEPVRFSLKAGESKTFELNSGDIYSITEDDMFGWGYIQSSVLNGAGTACEPEITVTYTNTYIGRVYIPVEGEKTWEFKGAAAERYPDSVTVELLANDEVVRTVELKPDTDGKWLYSLNVPKYDDKGKQINYTVREVPVDGFESVVDGFNINNICEETETASSADTTKSTNTTRPSDATGTSTTKSDSTTPSTTGDSSTTASTTAEHGDSTTKTETTTAPSTAQGSVRAESTTVTTTKKSVEKPKTGDTQRAVLWSSLMALSLLGIALLIYWKKHSYQGKYQRKF